MDGTIDISNSSFVQFQIWDFPGQLDFFDPAFDSDLIFTDCGALIFVIDAQDDFNVPLAKLNETVTKAYESNPNIKFEIFIHKVDGLTDDQRIEAQSEIQQRVMEDLDENDSIHLSVYLTSIYDHSIFEAFSKVIQKLIPQLPTLEGLLNTFIQHGKMEKAFLFDVVSKIYIATDSNPVDMQSYELCSDMIDVVIDVSCIYGLEEEGDGLAYDEQSSSIIKLSNGMVLYLREVNKYLALVCLMQDIHFDKYGLLEYNFECFKEAIGQVFQVGYKDSDKKEDGEEEKVEEFKKEEVEKVDEQGEGDQQ
eukprot:TRINITY_DN2384_c0_g2_i1.p1 TRINITY_DN2384_c0_g2~~TRINITY_DN2384_c0_g2_i1.p1  ORF type:complete len:307 (-),score=122.65 TRINITY_DN2384_c0_g2_i1:58-978(-)